MLQLETVSKTYRNGFTALEPIDLRIEAGERVAIVGSSGCGKSTLLRLAAGLCPPSTGRVLLHGRPVIKPEPSVGFIFQEPRLMPWLTVEQNVAFGLRGPARHRHASVSSALLRVGLTAYGHYYPKQLSGGMAQRVAIARALASAPQLILLDEPFSALDAIKRAELQEHFLQLWESEQLSTLIVTHDVEEAIVLADRILVMQPHPGRITEELRLDLPLDNCREAPGFEALKKQLIQSLRPPSVGAGQTGADPVPFAVAHAIHG
ncbi:ABC transporter ATP-binding protein [Vulcanococcus limneticus Candia 3F8]|uniref:ABC transporter ATP-binding protein n=1 Tax=Vulcanococcus limneticus TaxID=2170428 RepID=UPI000B99932C|nr:ABC transporter ATP-binding protein [Vulcanococcus limneticus]MCP9790769.1 ABC transporter ATP-binding protein [Vulcanococcus limneticus MW73D5]MCP9892888.1 ABC transporter ATP-binding protein [Vulcanococcus limneticus Candia 3F8]MCP9896377.1 ABC transporter ATP-binding protein [Vulcanococcus limneticus Candia 3B3]